ncbi:hypothetical protein CL634_05070 [bacterium]|nr:hypothetical protein [bacterium]
MNLKEESDYLDQQAFFHQQTLDFWRHECEKLMVIKEELPDESEFSSSNVEVDHALEQAIFRLNYEMDNMEGFEEKLRLFLKKKDQNKL